MYTCLDAHNNATNNRTGRKVQLKYGETTSLLHHGEFELVRDLLRYKEKWTGIYVGTYFRNSNGLGLGNTTYEHKSLNQHNPRSAMQIM